jgi:ADP-heptose:LPS heptosyltransferase
MSGRIRAEATITSLPYPRWRYGLAALLTGAKTRIGDAEFSNPLLNLRVDTKPQAAHWVERNLALLPGLGLGFGEPKFEIPISRQSQEGAQRYLREKGLAKGDRPIGLHPGSGNPMRRWPEDRFVEIGKALAGKGNRILVFGGLGEAELAERVASGIGPGAASFCGDLPQVLALISLCRALAAADSGLAHCAAALGIPTLAIMGPSDENAYRPYGPHVRVLTNDVSCRPCYRPGGSICCPQKRRLCLDIGTDRVLAFLKEMI